MISLLLIEVGVRLLIPQHLSYEIWPGLYRPDPALGWRRAPDVRLEARRDGLVVGMCTDALGDRISCDRPPRADCPGRMLVVGDSFVEAMFVPYEETVWARIADETGWCVHVAGVGGWGLGQYVEQVRERLAAPEPRYDVLVLNLFAGNDFVTRPWHVPHADSVQRAPFRLLPDGLSWGAIRAWLHPYAQPLESRSHAWVALRNRLIWYEWHRMVHQTLRPSWFTEARAETNLEPIRAIVAEVHAQGLSVLITLIPLMKQVFDPTGAELIGYVPQLAGDVDMDLPSRRMAPRLASLEGVLFVDLLPGLRERAGPGDFVPNDSHFGGSGHAIWYDLIRDEVLALVSGVRATPGPARGS
jgi:hypothetical protein